MGEKSWKGNSVEGQRESGEPYALGSATRRTGCYWSPGGLSSRNEPREIPRTGLPQFTVTRKAKEVSTAARRESRGDGIQCPDPQLGESRRFPQEMEDTWVI